MTRTSTRSAWLVLAVLAAAACGPGSSRQGASGGLPPTEPPPTEPPPTEPPPTEPPPTPPPPIQIGDWTYFGTDQGLSADVHDVSADEGGNVYVAGGDAVYAKRRADEQFLRFDAASGGLTANCNDEALKAEEHPAKPFYLCPIISVAGAGPGRALLGFSGFQTESADTPLWDWVLLGNGGADVVAFDGAAGTLSRVRHVDIGSPPGVICAIGGDEVRGRCTDPGNFWWVHGRHLLHRVDRIVVNHDPGTAMYGDAWFCGRHATFAALLADAGARGFPDYTAGLDPKYAAEKDVWEHLHPALVKPSEPASFVNGECTALSIDPRDGVPWGSNRYRTVRVDGYGPSLRDVDWWMIPAQQGSYLDLWPDPSLDDLDGATYDDVSSMSHCADGSLWVGSLRHGLARIASDRVTVQRVSLPDPAPRNGVSAVACDRTDGTLWIGLAAGGVMRRMTDGSFVRVAVDGAPAFAGHPVKSIQLDAWAEPRRVYVAFEPRGDAPGGVGAYAGP